MKEAFTARIVFEDDVITEMFKTEYFTYEGLRVLLRALLGIGLVFAGVFTSFPMPVRIIGMLIGCWLLASPDFPARIRAEGLIAARKGQKSTVVYHFAEDRFFIENGPEYRYGSIDRLIVDKSYFYIFMNRQTAVMVPADGITPADTGAFADFIEKKSGREFRTGKNFLTMNLRDLLGMIRDRKNS